MKIAYITYSGKPSYTAANNFNEITDVLPYLKNKGLDIQTEIWDDPKVDWSNYDVALLKTPWDYHRKFTLFEAWLDKMEALNITMLNDYRTVRWNFDKHYLKEVEAIGLEIAPSIFLNRGWAGELDTIFSQLTSDKIIIKPCISGGSVNTFVVNRNYTATQREDVIKLAASVDLIAQPFLHEIEEGEWSFIFFNGTYSHTIVKKPKAGDFRVQQAYGGTIEAVTPNNALIEKASLYIQQFAPDTLYARVDGLLVNNAFKLMELELIEPFLYLSYGEGAMERYYKALVEKLAGIKSSR